MDKKGIQYSISMPMDLLEALKSLGDVFFQEYDITQLLLLFIRRGLQASQNIA